MITFPHPARHHPPASDHEEWQMKVTEVRTTVVWAPRRDLTFVEADPWVLELVDDAPRVGPDGCFAVPERPGFGLALDHDACAEHPPMGGLIRLFDEGWEPRGG
jgi:hypothetical protein